MDIFQILEAIKPQSHVVTIQIASPKNWLDWFIGLGPICVALGTLLFSYKSTNKNIEAQKLLAIKTASVEIENTLRREWCADVRKCTIDFLDAMSAQYELKRMANSLQQKHKNDEIINFKEFGFNGDWEQYIFQHIEKSRQLRKEELHKRTTLFTYLDTNDNKSFYDAITLFSDSATNDNLDDNSFYILYGKIIFECRQAISAEWNKMIYI